MDTMTNAAWEQLRREIEQLRSGIRELPVVRAVEAPTLRAHLEGAYPFDRPLQLAQVVQDTARLLREGTVHVTHPRYFGLFNPSVLEAGILADALAAAFNPQLAVWSHAPAMQEIERHVLRYFARVLGFDSDEVLASFTSGGAEANLSAVLAAIAHRLPEVSRAGLRSLEGRPAIYLTDQSHHSFVKITRMAGLGTDALREVATTVEMTMDPESLRRSMAEDVRDGWIPLLVVATAGTTAAGSIDPLDDLAGVTVEFGAWYHVDAAWGAAAALSPRLRPLLDGIESADSVTWDAHKWLSVPMGAGMFFCRHPEALRRAFAVSTTYMPGASGGDTVDPYLVGPQWSRRAIGLKVFMALAGLGGGGYRELVERQTRMGDYLRQRLTEAGWAVTNTTSLPVVCFTHPAIRKGAMSTGDVLRVIHARGRVWISDVALRSERALRACITSYRTDQQDIEVLLEELDLAIREATSTETAGWSP